MDFLTNSAVLPYVIAAGAAFFVGIVLVAIYFVFSENKNKKTYDDQLNDLLQDEYFNPKPPQLGLISRWNKHWGNVFKGAGLARYEEEGTVAGRDAVIIFGLVTIVVSVFFGFILGPIVGVVALWAVSAGLKFKGSRKSEEINNQLPGFLFAFKANIQANETPENALIKVVDGMPSPLYEDLVIVKDMILARATLSEALRALSEKTSSRDLKFLAACIIQASAAGANLEKQISVIQNVLTDRKKISDEIEKAIRASNPAIYISTFVIPGSFLFTYFSNESAKDFWFVEPVSWIAVVIVILLYVAGFWLVKKLVDNIKNM